MSSYNKYGLLKNCEHLRWKYVHWMYIESIHKKEKKEKKRKKIKRNGNFPLYPYQTMTAFSFLKPLFSLHPKKSVPMILYFYQTQK